MSVRVTGLLVSLMFGVVAMASPLRAAVPDATVKTMPAHCAEMAKKSADTSKAQHKTTSCCTGGCNCPLSHSPAVPALPHAAVMPMVPMHDAAQFSELHAPAARAAALPERPPRS